MFYSDDPRTNSREDRNQKEEFDDQQEEHN